VQLDFLASADGGDAFPPHTSPAATTTVRGSAGTWRWVGELDVRDRDSRDSAILYDESAVVCAASGTFWLSDAPDVPGTKVENSTLVRTATWAVFGVRAWGYRERDGVRGGHVLFVNTHLDHLGELARRQQAQVIRNYVQGLQARLGVPGMPVVLTGDFNALRHSAAWRTLTDRFGSGATFTDVWHAARARGSATPVSGPFASFHGFLGLAVESALFRVPMVAAVTALASVTDRLPLTVAPTDMHIDWILTSGIAPADATYHAASTSPGSGLRSGWRLTSVAVVPYVETHAESNAGQAGGVASSNVAPSDHHPVVAEWEVVA